MALAQLSDLARILAMSVEELIGAEGTRGRRGPAPKLLQQVERIQRHPERSGAEGRVRNARAGFTAGRRAWHQLINADSSLECARSARRDSVGREWR